MRRAQRPRRPTRQTNRGHAVPRASSADARAGGPPEGPRPMTPVASSPLGAQIRCTYLTGQPYSSSLVDVSSPPTVRLSHAEVLARRIEEEIVAARWPVGAVLGTETELAVRYGVGRSVLRETARVLESHGVARRRPGPGGGLIVTRP